LSCFRPYLSCLAAARSFGYELTKGRITPTGKQCHLFAKRWTILLSTEITQPKKVRKRLRKFDISKKSN